MPIDEIDGDDILKMLLIVCTTLFLIVLALTGQLNYVETILGLLLGSGIGYKLAKGKYK